MEPITFVLSAAAITGLAGFTGWVVKDYIKDLKGQVRDANKRTEVSNAQARENTKAINEFADSSRRHEGLLREILAKMEQ